MPIYTIQTPSGRKLRIEAADQATALRGAQEHETARGSSPAPAPAAQPKPPVSANPVRALYDTMSAQGRKTFEERRAQPGPRIPDMPHPLLAIGHNFMEGARTVGASYDEFKQNGGPTLGSDTKLWSGLAAMPLSPFTGLQDALVTKPLSQATGLTESDVNAALSAARPTPGRSFAPRPAAPYVRPLKSDLRVARTLERAATRDATPAADIASRARADGMPVYQAGGENMASLAEVVAQSPGAGKQIVTEAVRSHQAGAPDRIKGAIGKGVGGRGDYFSTLDRAMEARKVRAEPFRQKAFAAPVDPAKYQSEIAPLMGRVPSRALSYAYEIAKRDGLVPEEALGLHSKGLDPNGLPIVEAAQTQPTMQTLHYVKKGMDADLQGYKNPVTGKLDLSGDPMAAATSAVRSDFGKALRRANPDYDKFMQTWGDDSGHINAMELGRDVFSPKFDAERLKARYGEMNQTERDFYRKGVGEALIAKVRGQGGVQAMRQLLKSEEFRDRVKIAFPHEPSYDDFMASAAKEVRMQERNGQVLANSRTDARGAARADLEAESGVDPLEMAANAIDTGLSPARLGAAALKQMLKSLPSKDRTLIGDPAANEALAKALTDPDEMTRLLNLLEVARARRMKLPSAGSAARVGVAAQPLLPKRDQ